MHHRNEAARINSNSKPSKITKNQGRLKKEKKEKRAHILANLRLNMKDTSDPKTRTKDRGSNCRSSCWVCWRSHSRSTCNRKCIDQFFPNSSVEDSNKRVRIQGRCVVSTQAARFRRDRFTYHMKKKNPVTRAGYFSRNPTGATFPSLKTTKKHVRKIIRVGFSSDRVGIGASWNSPGGFIPFGRRRRCGADRLEEVTLSCGIQRRQGFGDQKRRTELPSPD